MTRPTILLALCLALAGCGVTPCDAISAESAHSCLWWLLHPEDGAS